MMVSVIETINISIVLKRCRILPLSKEDSIVDPDEIKETKAADESSTPK